MVSPQLMAQAVTYLRFEANTMTAEALSPPNPAESLREQLIREGKIVPAKCTDGRNQKNELIDLFDLFSDGVHCISGFSSTGKTKFYEDALRDFENLANEYLGIFSKKLSVDLFSYLLFKKFKRFIKFLSEEIFFKIGSFALPREGFFYAFKENQKNTP